MLYCFRVQRYEKKLILTNFFKKIERLFENYILPLPPIWHDYCYKYNKNIKTFNTQQT